MKSGYLKIAILFFALYYSLITAAPAAQKSLKPQFVETKSQVRSFVDTIMRKYAVPGAMVGIWKNDTTVIELFRGTADIATKRPINRLDQVRIGSITKTFVASVLLELVDERKIALDDTLKKFLPMVPGAEKITIRELCNHTSGMHDVIEDTGSECSFVRNPNKHREDSDLIGCIVPTKLDFEPGSQFGYSNTGYLLLGMVIEKITGSSIGKAIGDRFITPFRLSSTYLPKDSSFLKQFCHGYMTRAGTAQIEDVSFIDPSLMRSAGSMISTFDDLKKWAGVLGEGAFLKPGTRAQRSVFSQGWNESVKYGLGMMKIAGFTGHSGGIFGYNTGMFYNAEKKISVVVVLNNCNYVDGHMTEVMTGIAGILSGTIK